MTARFWLTVMLNMRHAASYRRYESEQRVNRLRAWAKAQKGA